MNTPPKVRIRKLNDYEGFIEKFKPKKTTDDCGTPEWVYNFVVDWVDKNIMPLDEVEVVRPFWPGCDYTAHDYQPGEVVIDNPPFSILAKIRRYYNDRNIKYFLFAPALTLFSSPQSDDETFIFAFLEITYNNGATVRTSFATNMLGGEGVRVWVAGEMFKQFDKLKSEAGRASKPSRPKIIYPDAIITPSTLGRLAVRGIDLKIPAAECQFIRKLDTTIKHMYGGGFLLSERAAAERAAAERVAAGRAAAERAAAERAAERAAIKLELSPREAQISRDLNPH